MSKHKSINRRGNTANMKSDCIREGGLGSTWTMSALTFLESLSELLGEVANRVWGDLGKLGFFDGYCGEV